MTQTDGAAGSATGAIVAPAALRRADLLLMAAICVGIIGAVLIPQLRSLYPFTYDELVYLNKTRTYDAWLAGRLADKQGMPLGVLTRDGIEAAEALEDMHPGLAKLVGVIPHRLVRAALGIEGGARMTGALFLAIGACALYWMIVGTAGRFWAVVAALGLASIPRVFGHAHFHALDVPVMSMSLLAAGAFYYAVQQNRWAPALVSGLLVGLALGTKLTAAALLIHFALWIAFRRPRGWVRAVCGLAVAPLAFLAVWPWLWPDLLGRLARYVAFHSGHFIIGTTYLGTAYGDATTAPWHYPVVMLLLTLPFTWTLAGLGGIAGRALGRLPAPAGFLALGVVANVLLLALPGATRYGGMRLILSVYPFAVGFAVLAVAGLLRAGGETARPVLAAGVAAVALLAPGIIGCVTYYPYCLSYYTPPLGLHGAAHMGMEVTYWGDAFGGAREFMSRPENADARFYASNELATGVIDALIAGGEIPPQHRMLSFFIKDDIPPDADFILVDNHPPMWPDAVRGLTLSATPCATVRLDRVPLLWVFEGPARARADVGD